MMIENENSKEHSRLLFIRLCNVQKYTRGGGGGGGGPKETIFTAYRGII
jgi:hypothetical protein